MGGDSPVKVEILLSRYFCNIIDFGKYFRDLFHGITAVHYQIQLDFCQRLFSCAFIFHLHYKLFTFIDYF